jgi:hypothetical protein
VSVLSIRAYARHRGVRLQAVREAIASGRIALRPDGKVDAEAADGEWERNTDAGRVPLAHRRGDTESHTNGAARPGVSFIEQKQLESFERTRLLKLQTDRLSSKLVDAREVERRFAGHVITARNQLRGLPSKFRMEFNLTREQAARAAELIDAALEALADHIASERTEDTHAQTAHSAQDGQVDPNGEAHPPALARTLSARHG